MRTVFFIAKYTFIEAMRDKFIWFAAIFMLLGIPLGFFVKSLTLYGGETTFPAIVLAMITLSVSLVSVLYVNNATRRELDSKIMLLILSRPVSNGAYILGKHCGFLAVSSLYVVMGAVLIILLKIALPLLALKFALGLWLMQFMIVAWSLFFALLLNSLSTSILMSVIAWLLFNSTQSLWLMAERSSSFLNQYLGKLFYYILPNYTKFDLKHAVLYAEPVSFESLISLPLEAFVYTIIVFIFTWVDFSNKEF